MDRDEVEVHKDAERELRADRNQPITRKVTICGYNEKHRARFKAQRLTARATIEKEPQYSNLSQHRK